MCHISLLCLQEEDEVVVQTPEITQRVHHATDEEKLASTGITGPTAETQEEQEEPECNKAPCKKQPISDTPVMDGMFLIFVQVGPVHTPGYFFSFQSTLLNSQLADHLEHIVSL